MSRHTPARVLLAVAALAATSVGFAAKTPKTIKVRGGSAAAASTPTPANDNGLMPTATYDTFRMIPDRNIFNSLRTGRTSSASPTDNTPRGETISLVGTMESDHGVYAFFDGTDSSYRKALHEGDSLPPFKVTHIEPDRVELQRDGKSLTLRVAQQLRRPDKNSDWTVDAQSAPVVAAPSATDTTTPNTPPAIPSDASDVLRRLMEQRQKQLKQ